MSVLPIILAVGIDDSKSTDIIKSILDENGITQVPSPTEHQSEYTICNIDTKYYTANVQFRPMDCKTSSVENIANHIEAVVLYLDHSIDSLAKELDGLEVIRDIDTDCKILISKHSIAEDQKHAVDTWCSTNEYELIDFESNAKPTSDSLLDGNEKYGVQRLVEALQTHQWSNLQLKRKNVSKNLKQADTENTTHTESYCATPSNSPIETSPEDSAGHHDNMEELFSLFQNLKSMKLNISSLNGAEKLDQAEKVVKTFWNAIGGDMSEFSDSDNEVT